MFFSVNSKWQAAPRFLQRLNRGVVPAAFLLAVGIARAANPNEGLSEHPLHSRSAAGGSTLFTELAPAQTGMVTTNNYADPKMWWELYHEFEVGAIGTGVAIGDYDGDGLPDVFVVSKTESCRLFRNLGNFKFEDVTDKAGVGDKGDAALVWKQGATFVDVNNDGLLDLYVCRFNQPNLLYINQGDGTFKERAHASGLDVKDACGMAAFCDYDRDGWLDVFIQTNVLDFNGHPNGQENYLFHNNRDGTFANVTKQAGISGEAQGHSATWWDFDNDGWPDLYVANDFAAPDKLYRNNRDGTFTNVIDRVVPHMPFSAMGADLGDINNDGLIDFLVADMASTTHEKDQRGMVTSRSLAMDTTDSSPAAPQIYHNSLYLNTGTGRCLEAAYLTGLAATDWTWSVRFEDLDNDGRLDLFVTNGMHREATNADLLGRQMRAESATERLRIMRDSSVMAQRKLVYRNLGDLEFTEVGKAWGLDKSAVSFGAAFGDLDGDGDLDLVYANYQGGVTVLRNDGGSGHSVIVDLRGTTSNRFGVGATVRIETAAGPQVRQLVLARGYLSSSEPKLHFGLGPETLIKRLTVEWPSGSVQTLVDLPADRRFTVTEPPAPGATAAPEIKPAAPVPSFTEISQSVGLSLLSREEPIDETSVQRLLPVRLNRRGPAIAVGDLNGDGLDDFVLGGTTLSPAQILFASPSGVFTAQDTSSLLPAAPVDDGPLLVFDADGDGTNDLLVTRGGNTLPPGAPEYQPQLFLNDGRGHFRPAPGGTLPALPISAGAAVAADFDHDGRLDLFIGGRVLNGQYPIAPHSALLANRGDKFEDVTDRVAPALRELGMVTSALWTDVDGDGWVDLLLTLEWGNVSYFHNNQGRALEDWTERAGFASAGKGWWTSLVAADFNGDGKLDYVVGNVGLNTQYRATQEHPAVIYYGDFKGEGEEPQIIEAYYEGERLFPWRSRKDLGAAIPSILKRFPKNDAYARASLGEILGDDKLAVAQRFTATELRSGVFLSQPAGTYRFAPLPRLAQIAPLQGMVVGDFNRDGHADIYAAQNSFAPIPSVGRFDGGLSQLLYGDGHGHFTPVPPRESGLIVPGDAKALALVNFNAENGPDVLVTRNNQTTLLFRNRALAGHHGLRIQLRGPVGNPQAVGAYLTVEFADGSRQASEIYAGSSYYTQSSAAAFFDYAEDNPPRKIQVRWPGGTATEHPVPAGSTSLTLPFSAEANVSAR